MPDLKVPDLKVPSAPTLHWLQKSDFIINFYSSIFLNPLKPSVSLYMRLFSHIHCKKTHSIKREDCICIGNAIFLRHFVCVCVGVFVCVKEANRQIDEGNSVGLLILRLLLPHSFRVLKLCMLCFCSS